MIEKYNQKIGKFGEDLAVNFLTKRGYKIINRNLKISYKEIDIIAEDKDTLVFIEVKTRTSNYFGDGLESMNQQKNHNLVRATELYLYFHEWPGDARIDVILININIKEKIAKIKHYQNITG